MWTHFPGWLRADKISLVISNTSSPSLDAGMHCMWYPTVYNTVCMGQAVRLAAQVEGVVAEVVWHVFECDQGTGTHMAAIPPVPGERKPRIPCKYARISTRKRCTGHMMAAVSGREPCMHLPL